LFNGFTLALQEIFFHTDAYYHLCCQTLAGANVEQGIHLSSHK